MASVLRTFSHRVFSSWLVAISQLTILSTKSFRGALDDYYDTREEQQYFDGLLTMDYEYGIRVMTFMKGDLQRRTFGTDLSYMAMGFENWYKVTTHGPPPNNGNG